MVHWAAHTDLFPTHIMIGSAIFAGLGGVPRTHTDHGTADISVAIGCIRVMHLMQPNATTATSVYGLLLIMPSVL